MTDSLLSRLRSLAAKVTHGREWGIASDVYVTSLLRRDDDTECQLMIAESCGQNEDEDNMRFLAELANSLPTLLARIEAGERLAEAMRYYADEFLYGDCDLGGTARDALAAFAAAKEGA